MALLANLKPIKIASPKVRLGQKQDGGYVINEVAITKSNAIFTYGVGGDTGYEVGYRDMAHKPVFLFDPTHDMPNPPEGMVFHKEGLGRGANCKMFKEHMGMYEGSDVNFYKGMVLLKIDTEGAEYEYFMFEDIEFLSKSCTGIILEVHHLNEAIRQMIFESILLKLKQYFWLTHIHGNNWGGEFGLEGFAVPNVMELSFVNKSIADFPSADFEEYPIKGIDFPNRPDQPDCPLLFLKHI